MSHDSPATRPSSSKRLIVLAVVLIVLGLIGVVLYAIGAPDNLAEGSALGGLRGGLIIVSALCIGGGASLGLVALLRRRARN